MLASVAAAPETSCRKIEADVGVNKSRVSSILKKHKFKPYKIRVVQNLHLEDAERRIHFCQWYLQKVGQDPNFSRKVIWSDESYISSAGLFNRHNTRHWSDENQHVNVSRERQGRFGFSIACFILGTKVKYHIYQENLTANRYLEILQNILPELLDDVPLAQRNQIYFQQDGAPAHNSRIVRRFLEDHFPEHCITTHGPVRWPPRSPDLSMLDFFLWAYIKNIIYRTRHNTIEDLRNATRQAFEQLQERNIVISNALGRIAVVCNKCIRENGNQFQHLL